MLEVMIKMAEQLSGKFVPFRLINRTSREMYIIGYTSGRLREKGYFEREDAEDLLSTIRNYVFENDGEIVEHIKFADQQIDEYFNGVGGGE